MIDRRGRRRGEDAGLSGAGAYPVGSPTGALQAARLGVSAKRQGRPQGGDMRLAAGAGCVHQYLMGRPIEGRWGRPPLEAGGGLN